ncbi:MAG: hypothetical protein KDK41_05495 [Leptospiraceae bacterium]|nr:hypothetical protein [Leptospiraceae bacterium]
MAVKSVAVVTKAIAKNKEKQAALKQEATKLAAELKQAKEAEKAKKTAKPKAKAKAKAKKK